jgi:hypothetical protein
LAGTGMPNHPFYVVVPHVPAGTYEMRFSYTVSPAGAQATGVPPGAYTLCAPLKVH